MLQLVCQLRDKLRGQKLVIDTNTRKIAKAKTISQNTHQRCLYFFFKNKKIRETNPLYKIVYPKPGKENSQIVEPPQIRERERERGLAGACDYSYETSLFLGAKLPHNSPR
jgi:hypothetical protein